MTRPNALFPSPVALGVGSALSEGLVRLARLRSQQPMLLRFSAFSIGTADPPGDGVRLELDRSPPGNALGKGAGIYRSLTTEPTPVPLLSLRGRRSRGSTALRNSTEAQGRRARGCRRSDVTGIGEALALD